MLPLFLKSRKRCSRIPAYQKLQTVVQETAMYAVLFMLLFELLSICNLRTTGDFYDLGALEHHPGSFRDGFSSDCNYLNMSLNIVH